MRTIPTIQNKIKIQSNACSGSRNTIWICYRCNLTFNQESIVSLHGDITKHSVRKIEFPKGDLRVVT
ncbi:MAG: hypothetical protein E6K98_00580 [Thaumarchaeota archaeon]|nr:MAG: hypothetical protein E6K98_00580 [Nitrososphaerota archaeon]TLX94564.1 MAG: hypothetical protein E6K91_05750 [Nitrososphaerota archaeon]